MDEEERTRRVREYVRERLMREVEAQPRGYQAKLCREMKITSAHMSNALSKRKARGVGEVFARKAAAHWGVTYAELERLALGEEQPVAAPRETPAAPLPFGAEQLRAILREELEAIRREELARAVAPMTELDRAVESALARRFEPDPEPTDDADLELPSRPPPAQTKPRN